MSLVIKKIIWKELRIGTLVCFVLRIMWDNLDRIIFFRTRHVINYTAHPSNYVSSIEKKIKRA